MFINIHAYQNLCRSNLKQKPKYLEVKHRVCDDASDMQS